MVSLGTWRGCLAEESVDVQKPVDQYIGPGAVAHGLFFGPGGHDGGVHAVGPQFLLIHADPAVHELGRDLRMELRSDAPTDSERLRRDGGPRYLGGAVGHGEPVVVPLEPRTRGDRVR